MSGLPAHEKDRSQAEVLGESPMVASETATSENQGSEREANWDTAMTPPYTLEDAEALRVWSGALPAIIEAPARPWNGRALTSYEKAMARVALFLDGPQAALEWLSENAR
jgi:hypothetical protein